MYNLSIIEECYQKYIRDLPSWLPDGVIDVDLNLLHELDLLKYYYGEAAGEQETLTRHFHVIESMEKITLINDQFVIWIVPDQLQGVPTTYALVALNAQPEPTIELAFAASGVYNTSGLVLRILEKFLFEVQETQDLLDRYSKAS